MGVTLTVIPPPAVDLSVISPAVVALDPNIGTLGDQGIPGPPGPPGSGGDLNSVFTQSIASATWGIPIPSAFITAGKVPAVTVYDTAGTNIIGGCTYDPIGHTLTVTFTAATAGTASLN